MAKGVKFTREAAGRIVDAVRLVERTPRDQTGNRGQRGASGIPPIPLRLTARSGAGFSWSEVRRNAASDGWEDNPHGISSADTGLIAREASGRVGFPYGASTGMIALAFYVPRDDSTDNLELIFYASLDPFYARVTATNGSTWAQVHSTGVGTWDAMSGGLTHTSTGATLREVHGATVLPNTADACRVFLVTPVVDSSGVLQYCIDLGRSFHCLLTSGSGSQGDETTPCGRVYTWTYEDGTEIVTSTAPANMRPTVGFVTDGDEAVGRWYSGAFVPGICNEVADAEACGGS